MHVYNTILKPNWNYGLELRGTAVPVNIEIILKSLENSEMLFTAAKSLVMVIVESKIEN